MKVYSIILLLLLFTVGMAGPRTRTSFSPLRLKFMNAANEPLKKLTVEARFISQAYRRQFTTQLTTDDSGFAQLNLQFDFGAYWVNLEAKGFEDHSFNITPKTGETGTIDVVLRPVEEIEFVPLPREELGKLEAACKRSDLWDTKMPSSFDNEQRWKDSWSAFLLEAPAVDFKKWHVVGFIIRHSTVLPPLSVRRVIYDPKTKRTAVRLTNIEQGDLQLPAIDCKADYVLIPANLTSQP